MTLLEIDEAGKVWLFIGFTECDYDEHAAFRSYWDEAKSAYSIPLTMTAEEAKQKIEQLARLHGWQQVPMTDANIRHARKVALGEEESGA